MSTSNEGMRVADESNALAEAGAGGLKKILSGLGEVAGVVSQIARATDEQEAAARTVVSAVTTTSEQARVVAASTAEQVTSATSIAQGTTAMRKIARTPLPT